MCVCISMYVFVCVCVCVCMYKYRKISYKTLHTNRKGFWHFSFCGVSPKHNRLE